MKPKFFKTQAEWHCWLEKHHGDSKELIVGFYKKGSGKASIDWPQSVDGALCFGWIDGVRRGLDEESYCIRFTPRKARSIWSAVNIARVAELTANGSMRPAGLAAFAARTEARSGIYAFEQDRIELNAAQEAHFWTQPAAWAFFQTKPPGYRKIAIWWVISAKREETREKRLATLIQLSGQARLLPQLDRKPKAK